MNRILSCCCKTSIIEPSDYIHKQCQEFILSNENVKELMTRFNKEIEKGLSKATNDEADVKCFPTYVQNLPDGTERGKFLALDLGGTNFRVLMIHLKENYAFDMKSKVYTLPQKIMLGTGDELFDHIAACLADFMNEHNMLSERLPLGFTFSFPLSQLGLTKGILVRWTKGFNCSGVIGKDVVQLLKDAIEKRGDIQIIIFAILNDTTGTLMSCAWKNANCRIGLIVGTGSNACYMEKSSNVETFIGELKNENVIVNTEWGAFGDSGQLDFIRTEFDRIIDANSINPNKQIQEKMISGMYMGELVRLALVKFTKSGHMFGGQGSDLLYSRDHFNAIFVSEIESEKLGHYDRCREILRELEIKTVTEQDCANVRYICECISSRSAQIVSAGIAALINRMNETNVVIGVDGSVYRFHPQYHNLMVEKIGQLVRRGINFDVMLSEDGSGRGAALVAAVAYREKFGTTN